jgi:type IV pilus assembly protein PilA
MLPQRLKDSQGFTLLEVLVVMLIIGILAAIALPVFLGQNTKAKDSEAKMNVGTMQTHVESCFTATENYGLCETGDSDLGDTKMPIGTGTGQTQVASDGPRDFTIESVSASGNTFRLVKVAGHKPNKSCSVPPGGDRGGCQPDSTW